MAVPFKIGFPEARLLAAKERPYYAGSLWSLLVVPTPGLGTMGVDDKNRIYVDPAVFDNWNLEEAKNVVLHEILHRVLRHDKRAKVQGVTPEQAFTWNIAADMEVNNLLREDGITKLPGKPYYPETLGFPRDLLAEEYYALLQKKQEEEKKKSGGDSGKDGEDGKGGKGSPKPGKNPGEGNCGSCAHGHGKEQGSGTGHEQGEATDDQPGQSEVEADLTARAFARAVQEAVAGRGKVPAGLARWANTVLAPPRIPWEQKLRAFLRDSLDRRAGAMELSFGKPNRRQWGLWDAGFRVALPSQYQPSLDVVAIVDTSGSMGEKEINGVLAEVKGIAQACGAAIRVACVDAQAYELQTISENQRVKVKGGGGTDMRLGIELAHKAKPRPHVCVVLTDGWTPWPNEKPSGMAVIACITPGGKATAPAFIKTICIDSKEGE